MRPQGLCADVDLAQGVRVLGQRVSLTPRWLPQPISLKNLAALRQFSGCQLWISAVWKCLAYKNLPEPTYR
jgi:hypothetical protein